MLPAGLLPFLDHSQLTPFSSSGLPSASLVVLEGLHRSLDLSSHTTLISTAGLCMYIDTPDPIYPKWGACCAGANKCPPSGKTCSYYVPA